MKKKHNTEQIEERFRKVLIEGVARKKREAADQARSVAAAAAIREVNRNLLRETLASEALPVLRIAVLEVEASGGYAEVREMKSEIDGRNMIVMVVALRASGSKGCPQTFVELSYTGEIDSMSVIVNLGERKSRHTLEEITRESVAAAVVELLSFI